MFKRKLTNLLVILCLVLLLLPVTVLAAENGWVQNSDGSWSYYQNGEKLQNCIVKTDGTHYLISKDGNGYTVITQSGWLQAFGEYYYITKNGSSFYMKKNSIITSGSHKYYLGKDGVMVTSAPITGYDNDLHTYIDGYATADGSLLRGGWVKEQGLWRYADERYNLYTDGIYAIDGVHYYFRDGYLADQPGEYDYGQGVYVSEGGPLYRNRWYCDNTGYETGWVYYGNYAERVYGIVQIDGKYYYFGGETNVMQTNTVAEYNGTVYSFGADGVGTAQSGWFKHPENGRWMYASQKGLASGVTTVDGISYCFSYDNTLYPDQVVSTGSGYYLSDKNGCLVTGIGWHQAGGNWYYVQDTTGQLASGWLQSGGQWYFLDTWSCEMETDTLFFSSSDGKWYYANSKGVCTSLTGSGFRFVGSSWIYLENGVPVTEQWRKVGGVWYYFGYDGAMYAGGAYSTSDGKTYLFNSDGSLSSGWFKESFRTYYAGSDGAACTGWRSIGGQWYYFDDSGVLQHSKTVTLDGTIYLLADDGHLVAQLKEGWNQVGSDWYYIDRRGSVTTGRTFIDGVSYCFDRDGRLYTNGIYEVYTGSWYLVNANGKVLTGWHQYDGKWVYGDPDGYNLVANGIVTIDGNRYIFKDCTMQTGTVILDNCIYTVSGSGIITSENTLPAGWYYDSPSGRVCYSYDGNLTYTGWIGSYYVRDGYMLANEIVEYNGRLYYLGADGLYVKNGWYQTPQGEYVLAKADGSLYTNEWLRSGSVYYYFCDGLMVHSSLYIGGELHDFDETGKWLGVREEQPVQHPQLADGWQNRNGKWYYYHAGQPVTGQKYISGKYYYFDYTDRAMVTDDIRDYHYYGADGVLAQITGWRQIQGNWYYFEDGSCENCVSWIYVDGYWYYFQWNDAADPYAAFDHEYVLLTDTYAVIDGLLYHFDAGGRCSGSISGKGWYQAGTQWYYFSNGSLISDGLHTIDGKIYAFADGAMISGTSAEVAGQHLFFGSNGALVTRAGWYRTENSWAYVGANGQVCWEGAYRIDGVIYSFVDGIMVE